MAPSGKGAPASPESVPLSTRASVTAASPSPPVPPPPVPVPVPVPAPVLVLPTDPAAPPLWPPTPASSDELHASPSNAMTIKRASSAPPHPARDAAWFVPHKRVLLVQPRKISFRIRSCTVTEALGGAQSPPKTHTWTGEPRLSAKGIGIAFGPCLE